MKCSKCQHNEANVYIEQSINGETRTSHLCSECAFSSDMTIGFNILPGITPSSVHNFWFAPDNDNAHKSTKSSMLSCSVCGYSFSNFKKSSMLGCSTCYNVFEPELLGIFGKLQPGTRHIGKIPKNKSNAITKNLELTNLKSKLQAAISNEEYEEAAKIRDLIRGMEVNE